MLIRVDVCVCVLPKTSGSVSKLQTFFRVKGKISRQQRDTEGIKNRVKKCWD